MGAIYQGRYVAGIVAGMKMKELIDAGTITMGGYDYHGQGRATGEIMDLRAGRCMGACLEYAARRGVPRPGAGACIMNA